MRTRRFVLYEETNLMAFSSEEEQLQKFRNDETAQHYFEVLRTLISKNLFLLKILVSMMWLPTLVKSFSRIGAEVTIDETYTAPLSWQNLRVQIRMLRPLSFISIMILFLRITISLGRMNLFV